MEQLKQIGGAAGNAADPTKHRKYNYPPPQERCFTWSTISQPELWQPSILAISLTNIGYLILNFFDYMPYKVATNQFGYVCCIFGFAAACLIYVRYLAKEQYYSKLTIAIIITLVIALSMYVVFWLVQPSPKSFEKMTGTQIIPLVNYTFPTTLPGNQASQGPTNKPPVPPLSPKPPATPAPPPTNIRQPQFPRDCRESLKCSQPLDLAVQSVYIISVLICLILSSLQYQVSISGTRLLSPRL